jgi:hypothetical protein
MKKFRTENCELGVERRRKRKRLSAYSQFSILNSQFLIASLFLWATLAKAASPSPEPTRTPTPRPRLSGGFGRPAATPVSGQETAASSPNPSVNDVVRAAEQGKTRREQSPGLAITNDSLVTDPRKGKITTSSPRNLPAPTASKPAEPARAAAVTPAAPAPPASTAGTEQEWRERASNARSRVEELKQRVAQLEAESKKLENDFYSWDDGSYRDGVIKPAWDRKKEDLAVARKDLTQAEADLAELPEKARKAGALPGWLRE